jgi:hypothetical protein
MQEPGIPPQCPHVPVRGAADGFDEAGVAPTAKTLSVRAVFFEPHDGHATFASLVPGAIDRTSFSNFDSQLLHVYS